MDDEKPLATQADKAGPRQIKEVESWSCIEESMPQVLQQSIWNGTSITLPHVSLATVPDGK